MVLRQVAEQQGLPLAVYHDRHTIFGSSKAVSIEDQLAGRRRLPSHVERALQDVGIESISARSPQAKGRIERLFATLQDRLVIALRLAGAATVDEANAFLPEFVATFNGRFGVAPASSEVSYRRWPEDLLLDEVFCFKYERTVGADNIVRFDNRRVQLLPGASRISYAKCTVDVHERLDGSLAVYYKGQGLATTDAPFEATVLRSRGHSRPGTKSNSGHRGFGDRQPAPDDHESAPSITETTVGPTKPKTPWVPPSNHPWRKFDLSGH